MPERQRNCGISFRVTEKEKEYFDKKRAASKLTLRDFIFECLRKKAFVVKPGGPQIVSQLKKIGNNLNQVTHKVNAGQITDCRKELNQIREEIAEIRKIWQ